MMTTTEIEEALRADANDDKFNAWEDEKETSDEKWQLRYIQSLRQAALYHLACICSFS